MSKIIIMTIISIFIPTLLFGYTPPKGIPNPAVSFSTFGEIDQATPSTATKCPTWPSAATTGCYYVDNTHVSATDTANTYGYPDKPRATIPSLSGLAAGTFIYVHAGTYSATWYVTGAGTASNPIWITGNPTSNPVIQRPFNVGYNAAASYIVIENFTISNGYDFVSVRNADLNANIDHILIRNNTAYGSGVLSDPSMGAAVAGNTSDSVYTVNYVVFYKNTFHDYGDRLSQDGGGIYFDHNVNYGWALDNKIYNISGDGIAGCHTCNVDGNQPHNVFIGRNTLYGHGENCIDLKGVHDFIISENTCYGPFTREQGWGIVIHDSEATPYTEPSNGWIIFNNLYHLSSGIAFVSNSARDMYIVGNLIHDIHASYAAHPDAGYNGRAVLAASNVGKLWIVDNTIHDYEEGIKIARYLTASDSVQIHGNILSGRTDAAKYEVNIAMNGAQAYVHMSYDLFYGPSGTSSFYWGGASRNYSYIVNTALECNGCKDAQPPLFAYAPFNLKLQATSPARDVSVEGPTGGVTVYNTFYNTWGMSINRDYAGKTRPQGPAWDIGAYEYSTGSTLSPPQNFKIK